MKPYLAVLIDSWAEAVSSKVLWVLLVAWTMLLLALAGFGYIEEVTFRFTYADISGSETLLNQLSAGLEGKGTIAQQKVARSLSNDMQKKLKSLSQSSGEELTRAQARIAMELVQSFNQLLDKKDFYDEKAWPNAIKRSNLKDLVAKPADQLLAIELQERNRRLIESAFSSSIRTARGDGLWLGYAGFKLFQPLPLTRAQANQFVQSFALTIIIKFGIGIIAIFVSVIVTAPLIPDMLQAGSLHLLLSKPVSRSLLFLSKFLGGCIFVLLNIAYILVGLYFIAGLRFGLWNEGLLAIIPVTLFVFVIFFSVSALAGVLWKNAIVCVVLTMVFWLVCFIVGVVREGFRPEATERPQITSLQVLDGELLGTSRSGRLMIWNTKEGRWQDGVSSLSMNRKVLGPVRVGDGSRLVYAYSETNPFEGAQGARGKLRVVDLEKQSKPKDGEGLLLGGNNDVELPRWEKEDGPDVPDSTRQLVPWKDSLLAFSSDGIYRLDANRLRESGALPKKIFGLSLPTGGVSAFERISPLDWECEMPAYMAVSGSGDQICVYHRGKVSRFVLEGEMLKLEEVASLEGDEGLLGLVAADEQFAVVVRKDQPIELLTHSAFSSTKRIETGKIDGALQIQRGPKPGTFLVVYQDGDLMLVDANAGTAVKPSIKGQGTVSAVHAAADGSIWVAYGTRHLVHLDAEMKEVLESRSTPRNQLQIFYDFFVNPFYVVNPKPAALDETMTYLLEGKDSWSLSLDSSDAEQTALKIDPWTPLWSNAIFVAVMLGISCLMLARQEY